MIFDFALNLNWKLILLIDLIFVYKHQITTFNFELNNFLKVSNYIRNYFIRATPQRLPRLCTTTVFAQIEDLEKKVFEK